MAASDPIRDPHIQRLLDHFSVDPTDTPSFTTLEEHFFLSGAWSQLAGVYECRVAALEPASPARRELLLRLARLLEERLADPAGARRRLEELLRGNPRDAEALSALRRLIDAAGDLAGALQIAEMEEALELEGPARATLLAETGHLWLRLGDRDEARRRFKEGLGLDPTCDAAAEGFARIAEAEGRIDEAIQLQESRLPRLSGKQRVDTLEHLARLVGDRDPERVRSLLREVVRVAPERRPPLERLIQLEFQAGARERVDELQRQLWRALRDPAEKLALAVDAAAAQADEGGDVGAAQFWIGRAHELGPDDSTVQQLRARVARKAGRTSVLLDALERLLAIEGPSPMRLLELAVLCERESQLDAAIEWLEQLLHLDPQDAEALAALDRCLARAGRHSTRVEVLERRVATADEPEEVAALLTQLGDLCARELEAPREGERAWRRALEACPDDANAWSRLESLLRDEQRFGDLAALVEGRLAREAGPTQRATLWCQLGRLRAEALDDGAGARAAFLSALDDDPGARPALAGLRKLAESRGDDSALLEACERELALAPEAERACALLGELAAAARRSGDRPRAGRAAARWADLDPGAGPRLLSAELAREVGDVAAERRALEHAEGVLVPEPERRVVVLVRLAELALGQADPDALEQALHWYQEALVALPAPEIRARLIDLHRRTGRIPELVEQLRIQLDVVDPDQSAPLRSELARALSELGDYPAAVEAIRPAFDANPADAAAADLLESLLGELDRNDDLVDVLARRLEREPDPSQRRTLGARRAELLLDGLGRAAEAVTTLRPLADPSRDAALETLLDRALEACGDPGELQTWLEAREPHFEGERRAQLMQRRAALLAAAGATGDAIEILQRAERLVEGDAARAVRTSLLDLLRRHGSPREQLRFLDEVLSRTLDAGDRASLLIERGRLWAESLDEPERAVRDLEEAWSAGSLSLDELRRLSALLGRTRAWPQQARALGALAGATSDPVERRRAQLLLAILLSDGPDSVRDLPEAERLLGDLIEADAEDREAFDRLCSLYQEQDRGHDLCELLGRQLERPGLRDMERHALGLRRATLQLELSDPIAACETLRAVRARSGADAALDEILYDALERADLHAIQIELCEEHASTSSGDDRDLWLRRWLRGLEISGEPLEARLLVLDKLLERHPSDVDLICQRVPMLRALGRHGTLAETLEDALRCAELSPARRRAFTREALQLFDGPLHNPQRALALIEREVAADPGLRLRGARLAHELGDPAREAALLRPVLRDGRAPDAGLARQLALALVASGQPADAEELLWQALDSNPLDREVLSGLEVYARSSGDRRALLRLLERRFAVADAEQRRQIAADAFETALELDHRGAALDWLRRRAALEPLSLELRRRRVELETSVGSPAQKLAALRSLRERVDDPSELAGLFAEEAQTLADGGLLEPARQSWEQALRSHPTPPAAWSEALLDLEQRAGTPERQAQLLQQLASHPERAPTAREDAFDARFALLAAEPATAADAARELADAIARGADTAERQSERLERLLELQDALGDVAGWCRSAEQRAPELAAEARLELERRLARRLDAELGATEKACNVWARVLEQQPGDPEALRARVRLLRQPGHEAELARALEACAPAEPWEIGGPLLAEAARIHWQALGDAEAARRCCEQALAHGDAGDVELHALRARLCQRLGDSAAEEASLRTLLERRTATAGDPEVWLRLAELAAAATGREPEARDLARRALAAAPGDAEWRGRIRQVLERCRDFRTCASLLREELEAASVDDCPALLRQLARLAQEELSDPALCAEALEALAEVESLDAFDLEHLGDALLETGRPLEGCEHRFQALDARGQDAGAKAWRDLAQQILDRLDDAAFARRACDRALALDADDTAALELRASLHGRLGDREAELADVLHAAERAAGTPEAAPAWTRAAEIARSYLGDDNRAWALYRSALKSDATHLPALLGAGEIARARREWGEAERMYGLACSLLPGSPLERRLPEVARNAAEAALEQRREAEAYRYLELALEREPDEPRSLDAMASLALRVAAYERALGCLERRLTDPGLSDEERCDRQVRVAQAAEGAGDLERAARALEQVLERRPGDEVSRARVIDLLERLGHPDRAAAQLDAWSRNAPPEEVSRLALRAARLERVAGDDAAARRRLAELAERGDAPPDAWVELAELTLEADGVEATLDVTSRALEAVDGGPSRSRLLWLEALALRTLGRLPEAAERACEVLVDDPCNLDAARLLASQLGVMGDWGHAVRQIERALDSGRPDPAIESELWEAIGRAYSGPLEDIERARLCYQRSIESNPLRASAREALADTTAFDPAHHRDSIRLHRDLLESQPARPGSWRSLARIASHWKRDGALFTCETVLQALGTSSGVDGVPARAALLIDRGPSADAAARAALEIGHALADAERLPPPAAEEPFKRAPEALRQQLDALAGEAWQCSDLSLAELWRASESLDADSLPRKHRRRLRKALDLATPELLHALDPADWRASVLAQAGADVLIDSNLPLPTLLRTLISLWPATAHLDLEAGGTLGAAIGECPPARLLLLRTADAVIDGLGL